MDVRFFLWLVFTPKAQCFKSILLILMNLPLKNIPMKLAYHIKQKTKIAFLLFGIMVCTILIRIAEDKSIENIGDKIKSMYNDRLIPATDLFYISESIHAKRIFTDNYLKNLTVDHQNVKSHNLKIEDLLKKYERTFLTAEEKKELNAFKSAYAIHLSLEKKLYNSVGPIDYTGAMDRSYHNLFMQLNRLTAIQSQVGKELISNVQTTLNGTQIYTNLQYLLSILIGLMVMGLLLASKVVNVKSEKFNLN